ncbi:uncharacterized protein LOC135711185 [Ochlerotatus camptorhynchus]|uniref:uncharacterized protein LOC135711185 n=1 Tax=Ochlerotatus camptorhynchus TaxID=644619 RepID=UPI0031DF686D
MRGIIGVKSFNISEPQDCELKKSQSKWSMNNRKRRWLPVVFCVICFSLLIAWVLRDIFHNHSIVMDETGENDTAEEAVEFGTIDEINGKSLVLPVSDHCCSFKSGCKIVCTGMNVNDISTEIGSVLEGQSCDGINLTIEYLYIEDGNLFPRWLDLNESIRINQLELKNSDIADIPAGSFDARQFYGMSILTLDSLQVTQLHSNVFLGLQLLQELNLKNLPLENVQPFVLAPVKFTLTRLLVEGCMNLLNPREFTGSTTMDNLAIVSFEYNILDDVMTDDSFAKVPSLSSLYLRHSHIKTLRVGMIESISKSVEQIYLNGNELSSIEEGVFDSLVDRRVKIYLKSNPLVCDCNLSYFKNLIVSNPSMFDEVKCAEPKEYAGMLISQVEMCNAVTEPSTTVTSTTETTTEAETTETTEVTTDPTTEFTTIPTLPSIKPTGMPTNKPTDKPNLSTTVTPTQPSSTTTTTLDTTSSSSSSLPTSTTTAATSFPGNLFTMQCIQTAVPTQSNITNYQDSELSLKKRSKTFTLLESQEGAVELILDQSYSVAVILWFYDTLSTNSIFTLQIEDSASCAHIYGRTVRISNLTPDKNYIFCVLYRYESTISPFDCLPHKLLPAYGQRTWLIEDQKITMISILIASLLVAIMSGVVMSYCFIKSFDSYQKSCRKVTTDLRIERSTTNQCYMTPVAQQPERPRHKRSVSDTSIESCRSYVSAVVPATQFQYISWKMDNRSRPSAPPHSQQQSPMEYYPKDPPPPPLPPHPTKRLKKQKSEIKINFHEIYDEPTNSSSYSPGMPKKCHH